MFLRQRVKVNRDKSSKKIKCRKYWKSTAINPPIRTAYLTFVSVSQKYPRQFSHIVTYFWVLEHTQIRKNDVHEHKIRLQLVIVSQIFLGLCYNISPVFEVLMSAPFLSMLCLHAMSCRTHRPYKTYAATTLPSMHFLCFKSTSYLRLLLLTSTLFWSVQGF